MIETNDLGKVYSTGRIQVKALDGINLSVPKGAFLGIAGPSGSGKSTLMNLLGGLDTPTSGSIQVAGRMVSSLNHKELALYRRFQVGMIFQSFNIIPAYTAKENVALPLLFSGVPKRERLRRAEAVLSLVGLEERKDHRPSELSGGEQQRVAVARALINSPDILLADEPTGNLDSRTSQGILNLLQEMNRTQNLTVLLISHEGYLLKKYADDIIYLHDGRVRESEAVE
ncbi:MAG: ABC transporter ATP-binding protein [Acidobacteria bacterium]|nr:ABC transporter ATP-binding protein [Acidobacteriota bacterium]MBU1474005.1 ABC transporter ATP-binding protein [Acidobacteriota bacterium]